MSTIALDIALAFAFLFTLPALIPAAKSSGPEGPVGAFIIPIPSGILLAIILSALIARGRFDWVPGGRVLCYLLLPGMLVGMAAAMLATFVRQQTILSFLAGISPMPIIAATLWSIHGFESVIPPIAGRLAAVIIFGGFAAGGWGLMLYGLFVWFKNTMDAAAADAAREQADYEARKAAAIAEFRALPADAPLDSLLSYVFAADEDVERECRERVAARSNLDEELIERLKTASNDITIAYIANAAKTVSPRLASAYAGVMERTLEGWRSTIENDPYVGKSEIDLRRLIDGADRIQSAGGDLRPQLRAWEESVSKSKVLGGLAMQIRAAIERTP